MLTMKWNGKYWEKCRWWIQQTSLKIRCEPWTIMVLGILAWQLGVEEGCEWRLKTGVGVKDEYVSLDRVKSEEKWRAIPTRGCCAHMNSQPYKHVFSHFLTMKSLRDELITFRCPVNTDVFAKLKWESFPYWFWKAFWIPALFMASGSSKVGHAFHP